MQQAAMIRELGGEAHVFALRDASSDSDRHRFGPVPVTFCDIVGPAQIGYAPSLVKALLDADLDCLHQQGIWMYPSRAGLRWTRRTRRPLIVTPQGMLDPWITARGRWKKAVARAGYERAAWRAAARLHALSAKEARDILRESGRNDSVVIPNPAPPLAPGPTTQRPPHLLYIGRIHAKKNVLALVEAWSLAAVPSDAKLTIAGWGDASDIAALEAAVAAAPPTVEFVGPVFDEAKQRLFHTARYMILPSFSEGLPLAVLESFSSGTPTIMTEECNVPEGFTAGASIECGYDAPAIARAIEAALQETPTAWQARSQAARALATGLFSAEQVAAQWVSAYRPAIGRPQPLAEASSSA